MKSLFLIFAAVFLVEGTAPAQQQTVLMDAGLRMPFASFTHPEGFALRYVLSTNPQTGQYDQYFIELENARGSLIRMPGEITYAGHQGTNFHQALEYLFLSSVQDVTDIEFGETVVHHDLINGPIGQRLIPALRAEGMLMQAWRVPFRGNRGGAVKQGRAEIVHTFHPAHEGIGTVVVRVLMCDASQIDHLLESVLLMDRTFQQNPQYEQTVTAIRNEVMRRMTEDHQFRMARQQQMFDSHQRKMQGIYAANEAQNRQWRENFFNSWNTAARSDDYSFNEAWRDTLTGQTTFNDPATGHQVKQDGHYNHWFTDGAGNYRGSDDSSFNPGSGWQRIQPVSPR